MNSSHVLFRLLMIAMAVVVGALPIGAALGLVGVDHPLWAVQTIAAVSVALIMFVIQRRERIACRRFPLLLLAMGVPLIGPLVSSLLGIGILIRRDRIRRAAHDGFVRGVRRGRSGSSEGGVLKERFVTAYKRMNDRALQLALGEIIYVNNVPLAALHQKFRSHPSAPVANLGQNCLDDRRAHLEEMVHELRERLDSDKLRMDSLRGLCELILAILEERLVAQSEVSKWARLGRDYAITIAEEEATLMGTAAYFEARFALFLGEVEGAMGAWSRLASIADLRKIANPGDQFHLLGAEIALARGDYATLRDHVRLLEPDTIEKLEIQDYWLRPEPLGGC